MAKPAKQHKYYVTTTKIIYATDDDSAIIFSRVESKTEQLKNDNECTVNSIVRKDFGEVTETVIFGESCEKCTTKITNLSKCVDCSLNYGSNFKEANNELPR